MKSKFLRPLKAVCVSLTALVVCASCKSEYKVTVSNPLPVDRLDELVEVRNPYRAGQSVAVKDEDGQFVPSQVTYEGRVLFPVRLRANEVKKYVVVAGTAPADTLTYGQTYPRRDDDLAWENELVAFRAYGPSLQAKGERGFGYDLFTKRDMRQPMLPEMYERFFAGESYHVDRGHGMDCYAVGPTLGAGVAALMPNDTIAYPWCYRTVKILDNGPLRFTAELTFEPRTIGTDTAVVETRLIMLDAGSHLNRTTVAFQNLTVTQPIVAGLSLHDQEGRIVTDPRYVAYEDPTQGSENGKIYVGIVASDTLRQAGPVYFSAEEQARRNGTLGHLQAVSSYAPQSRFVYYWGYGWSKADIPDMDAWQHYLQRYVDQLNEPLQVSCEKE